MVSVLNSIWSWVTGKPEVPELPKNILFERDVTSDNDFWISCLLNPSLDIRYVNGIVTKILDTDKCIIDNKYHYQPKTEKEIRNFPYIELNSSVRVSLYREKNSDNAEWRVASCFLSNDGPRHQPNMIRANESVRVLLDDNGPTYQADISENDDNEDQMTVEVLGDMPKVIGFEQESIIQILFRNNSYVEEKILNDYQTMQGNKVQLSIVNKNKLPITIGVQSEYIFDITLKGKYLGKSTEKVEFIFEDITYKVGINIDVTDSRLILSQNSGFYCKREIDMQRLFELQNDPIVRGVHKCVRAQFPSVRLAHWNIPSQLTKCYWSENGKFNQSMTEVQSNIQKLYPAAFETLTYENYKAKYHTLLFMEEIEITAALQKYAQERIHFEHAGEYLVLKIPNLSEQRPSLITGDRAAVTDPPNCTKRLGECGVYEGIIHKVLADEIWLKFDPEFHGICGHWDYSVNFFNARNMYRKLHEVVNEMWKKNRLGESFLFPYRDSLEYRPSKLKILTYDKINPGNSYEDNLKKDSNTLLPQPKVVQKIRWFNNKLNSEQKNAVINIMKGEGRPMPYIIYGPPGTGKTITMTESIIQVYKEFPKSKLLICAPTNSAVDMLLSKLVNCGLFDKTIMKRLVSYNHFIGTSYDMDYDEYCALPELESSYHGGESDTKLIRKHDILKLRIVLSTEGTAGLLYMMGLKSGTFTHIFIDEAGQSTEPDILLPLSFLDPYRDGQVILAGDPKQLGPVVMSLLAKHSGGLGLSMLCRFINYPSYLRDTDMFPEHNGYNPKLITHLVENYRSLPEIMFNYNKLFYESLLVSTILNDNAQERILLNNLNENTHWDIGCKGPVIVHGIVGEDSQDPDSPSWFNPHEAFQVLLYFTRLMKSGISVDDIGIITPYASQVTKINELLKMYYTDIKLPKVGSVEMFQGQERMVIIISIVRSKSTAGHEKDKKFSLGFLVAQERTNVALSRAKSLLIIIGDPTTMNKNKHWNFVLSQAIKNDNYIGCNVPELHR
ncbi:probable RNA helicase armi [Acyrthosiphon pisum]|uniref:RNA helicase n=1 Tax=Acyrthosiphon pisum TaxID=7029 RepID=A0A8R2H8F1_ACYPI|nr:probable RNA helicase armi [Acyrthosiphon pisum]|eukprot:XP_001947174.1 PREDICTED: probable RNA helicase armi [Acyrthosiphon pisum]